LDRARRWRYCVHWRGVSQELKGGHSSITGDQEYSTTLLGDSEILSIKHSPKSHIPALRKGPDDCLKVLAIVDSEQVNDVLKHHPARLYLFEDTYDFPEQAAAFAA
jgi:hypothetical protein